MDDYQFKQGLDRLTAALQDTLHAFTKNIHWEIKALVEGRGVKFNYHAVCYLSQPELHFVFQDNVELYKDPVETFTRICILTERVVNRVQYAFMQQLLGKPPTMEEFEHELARKSLHI